MRRMPSATRRHFLQGTAAVAASAWLVPARAADPLRIGLVIPLTGPFATTGRQVEAAVRLYLKRNGDTVAGRKVELLVRDDTGLAPETTKRISQELVARDKVAVLAGYGLTPLALAAAPVATESRTPMVVMCAATSIIPQRSPFIVRSGFSVPQITAPAADWAVKDGLREAITMVTDYAPGLECEKVFVKRFTAAGGKVLDSIRTPLRNPDYGPFIQRVKDAKPQALFAFVPSGEGAALMKQFEERGLREAHITLLCTGDVLDDDLLESIGAVATGVVSSHHYSAAHDSPENKAYVEAFTAANPGMRPNFHGVGAYDGMHLIYEAVKKTGGDTAGEKLVDAMKGMKWVSPRGPMSIDPETRDVIQTVYIRRCRMIKGKPWNVEFDRIENFKDPGA